MFRALRKRASKKEGSQSVRSFADPALVIHRQLSGPGFNRACLRDLPLYLSLEEGIDFKQKKNSDTVKSSTSLTSSPKLSEKKLTSSVRHSNNRNSNSSKSCQVAPRRNLRFADEISTEESSKSNFQNPEINNYNTSRKLSETEPDVCRNEGVDILKDIIGGKFTDLKDSDLQETPIDVCDSSKYINDIHYFNDNDKIVSKVAINQSKPDGGITNDTSLEEVKGAKLKKSSLNRAEGSSFLGSYRRYSVGHPTHENKRPVSFDYSTCNRTSTLNYDARTTTDLRQRNSSPTAILTNLLSYLEASESVKPPLVSSRNTQSAARLNRIINVSFGPSYKNGGGASSTLPHTRTLPCALPTGGSSLRTGQDIISMHGRGGSLREELPRHGTQSQVSQRMDLVYVTERIISLAFPPDLEDSAYTMHLREVAHMLSSKHADNFRVFNLSSCQGEVSHYLPRVTELGWPPLLAPALEKLCAICKALESWLAINNQHVAVLHDREGYEKLGVVVAAYMHYTNICASTDTALDRYAMKRFFDDKIGQLYHPSQKRYVQYFSGLLSGVIRINSNPLYLHTLTLYGVPHFESKGGCQMFIKVYQGMTHIYTSGVYQITDGLRHVTIVLEQQQQRGNTNNSNQNNSRISGIQLRGDVLLKAYHRRTTPQPSREIIFRAQFHTCAVSEKVLGFSRLDLDDACNDLRFPLDGGIELSFSQGGDDPPRAVSNVSCDKSPCPITAWDSYDRLLPHRDHAGLQEPVPHTLGPIDGSLYATVTKRRNGSSTADTNNINNFKNSSVAPLQQFQQQHRLQQQHIHSQHFQYNDHRGGDPKTPQQSSQFTPQQTPHRNQTNLPQQYTSQTIGPRSLSTPHTPQHPLNQSSLPQHTHHHTPHATNHHLAQHQHHLSQHHHHHHIHHQTTLPHQQQQQIIHQQYQVSGHSNSQTPSHTPAHSHQHTHPSISTPSPQQTAYVNGRYAASVDSGFASSLAPLSPPTSDCPASSISPASQPPPSSGCQQSSGCHAQNQSQSHVHQNQQHVLRRFSDPNQLNMAPVAAVATRPMPTSGGIPNRVDARQLDELLAGMLLDIENIPDLRPGQTNAPDIDSIRCPDLTWNSSSRGRSTSSRSGPTMSPVNGYGGSHHGGSNHDSLLDTSISLSAADEAPYHTRLDSRPFSYGAVTSSPVLPRRRSPSPNSSPNRRPSREPMISRTGLESPRLVRRMSGSVGAVSGNTTVDSAGINNINNHSSTNISSGVGLNNMRRSPSPSPEPGSRGSTLRRERSQTLTNRIMAGDPSPPATLTRSHVSRSASRLDDPDTAFAPETLSRSLSGTSSSWLATQQRKLLERREAGRRADRGRQDRVMTELRTRIGQDSALSQLQSAPLGHVNYYPSSSPNDGLLTTMHQQSGDELTWQSDTEIGTIGAGHSSSAHRPVTPGFPPSTPTTPYLNQGLPPKSPTMQRKEPNTPLSGAYRSTSPQNNGHASPAPSLYHGPSRRSSLSSLNDSNIQQQEIIHGHPQFVKDISKFWYKPTISRDEAINILKSKSPGTFIVRDSNSFPGAFGLAVKVATPPPNVKTTQTGGDPANELVRHFLIEPTARGVRLKGCSNEPVFGSLSALVYQHSNTALALPCKLTLPERDPAASTTASATNGTSSTAVDNNALLVQGAACTVLYLHSLDTESLTGPQAVRRAVSSLLASNTVRPTPVHFKVSSSGITLTDNHRTLFFRQHFPVSAISHCGTDPDDKRWQHNNDQGEPIASLRMFGFVAKKGTARNQNQCHILAELEPEQPATAICNFVTKVMMTSANTANLV